MQILKMIKNRLHTKDQKMEYIKRLALENTERKKQIEKLTSQLEELSEYCKKMAEKLCDCEDEITEMAETVDTFERYSDRELRSMVEDMIDEKLPSNLDEICDVYDSYDFDEFVTMRDVEDQDYITADDLDSEVLESVYSIVDEKMKEYKTFDFTNPETLKKFLNALSKYIAGQTENSL